MVSDELVHTAGEKKNDTKATTMTKCFCFTVRIDKARQPKGETNKKTAQRPEKMTEFSCSELECLLDTLRCQKQYIREEKKGPEAHQIAECGI